MVGLLAALVACDTQDEDLDADTEPNEAMVAETPEQAVDLCAAQTEADACGELEVGPGYRCLWAEPVGLSEPCADGKALAPRCLAAQYHGEGCGPYCGEGGMITWRELEGGGYEVFADPLCEYTTIGWEDWSPPAGVSDDEIACMCG